jgi:hypothetical protein
MSAATQRLLAAFDALPDTDREAVVAELLTRHPVGVGELPDAASEQLADELVLAYDPEVAADATPPG